MNIKFGDPIMNIKFGDFEIFFEKIPNQKTIY
jgi:hypothetical protein